MQQFKLKRQPPHFSRAGRKSYTDANLGVKAQGDLLGEPERRKVIISCDEDQEVFKGKLCLTI